MVGSRLGGVRIELSIVGANGCRDVAIVGDAAARLGGVLGELAVLAGGGAGDPAWCGTRLVSDRDQLAECGMYTGSTLSFVPPHHRPTPVGVRSLALVGGAQAGQVVALGRGPLSIGRAPGCDVVLDDDRASRMHASLDVARSTLLLRDLGSTNGTTVDGAPVPASGAEVRLDEIVRIGDSLLSVAGAEIASALVTPSPDGLLVNRAPRQRPPAARGPIAGPSRAGAREQPRRFQWITALLPAIGGVAIAILLHAPQFLLFALLSPVMLLSGAWGDRVHWRRSRRRAEADYRRARAVADAQIRAGLVSETSARRTGSPDPPTVLRIAQAPAVRLWERSRADADWLIVRVGSADLPSLLQTQSGSAVTPAGVVTSVPVHVDLRAGPLGVAGPGDTAAGIARWIVAQLAVLHSPLDLEFVFLLDPGAAGRWDWARWLPHTRDAAIDPDDLGTTIARLSAVVATRRSSRPAGPSAWSGPWTVVVLDRASSLAAVAGLPELLGDGPGVGVTVVCIDPAARGLPAACTSLVRSEHAGGSRIGVRTQAGTVRVDTVDVVGDRVPAAWAEDVARALAPLVDAGNSGAAALPTRCSLGDLMALDIDAVTARWGASDGGAHTVVGVAPDGPLTVDLGRDGPHALIAGTTGSGKSELLRTLVIGLAATHPPSELTFLLIDYKGGAAFDECAALPHTAGLVTDLDQHLTRRALTSLHAELRRREQLFADVSAADLTVYRALGPKAPVARLVIVVDEFAALAVELPDFVSGLVGVAQRGRSLGVHLVLATQRPGTALSPEIRANTSLRIALRMTDAAESTDVIDGPGAALLDSAVPGRAFLRAGSSPVPFQTAAACGEAAGEPVVEILDHWRRRPVHPRPSGCDEAGRLVAALSDCAMRSGQPAARSPWRDVLPEAVCQLDLPSDDATIALGRVDRPEHQEQPLLDLDLRACESTLVVGRSGSGRSTALATIALGAAAVSDPLQLEIYVVDGRGDLLSTLIGLPHVATAIGPDHIDSTARLLQRLHSDARTRRRPGGVLPLRLLLLDAWDAVLSGLDEVEAARCIDLLTTLIRSGAMTVAVSGDRSLLLPRFAGGFGTRLLLALSDRNDYALGGVRLRDVPTELPPGRGVRAGDGVTFQLAHPGRTLRPGSARSRAQEVVARWAAAGGRSNASPTAVRLRPLPSQVSLSVAAAGSAPLVLGLAGDAAAPCSVDLVAHRARFLIAGPPRAGKSVTLCVLLAESLRLGVDVVVAATNRSPLTVAARAAGVRVILPGDSQAAAGPAPTRPTMLLVDDSDAFVDGAGADRLVTWLQNPDAPLATAVAGRYDDLAATYRGVAAQVRRDRCGLLLRPGPIDGELLGIRVGRRADDGPPGRGLIVGDPRWGPLFDSGEPVPIQVAQP